MKVKTNIQLAQMIVGCAFHDASSKSLVAAAEEVLAAEDKPDIGMEDAQAAIADAVVAGDPDALFESVVDLTKAHAANLDGEKSAKEMSIDDVWRKLNDAVTLAEGLKRELGSLGVAYGLLEGLKNDAVKALERLTAADGDYYTDAPECSGSVLLLADAMTNARMVIAKCKTGETEQPALMLAPDGSPNDFFLVPGHNGCWVEVGDKVVYIWRDETRVNVQIFNDAREEPLSTAAATFGYETQGQVGSDAPGQG